MRQRILSVLLALCIMASLLTGFAVATNITSDANGSDFTDDPVLAYKLDKVFKGTVQLFSNTTDTFALGDSLDNDKAYKVANVLTGYQCYIYAQAVYYYLTGDIPYRGSGLNSNYFQNSKTLTSFKAATGLSFSAFKSAGVSTGAYIRTTNNSDGSFNGNDGHSMIVLDYNSDNIWILHGNADNKGLVCITKISWSSFNNTYLTKPGRCISHIVQPTAALPETFNLYCHNNYSGKNYLYGTDFSGTLNSDIIYSRDESVTTVSTDQTTTHNGYGSLKIVNTAAGASGKDLAIVTLTNDREANGNIADNKEMTLSFWAKASNADTKIYFRWGYGTYNGVTLTKDWAYYTVPMNKVPTYGQDMHPYVDRAGTVWIAEMQLEDGTAATAFVPENTNPINHAILEQSLGQKYQLPADPVREGYTFAGWYTANRGGTRITANTTVLEGDLIVYAHWDSDCTHQYQSSVVTAATCTEEGLLRYTCSLCGDSYTEIQPALGHSFGAWSHVDGSNPSTHSRKCSRCNEIETENCSFTNGSCTVCKFNPNVEAKLIVSHTRGAAGTTVTVDVSVEKNPGIVSAYLDFNYDTTKLTLTNAEDTGLLKGGLFSNDYTTVPFALNWDDSLATTNNTANGVIAKLTFQIKEDCPEGTVPITLSFAQGNIIDKDLNNVDFMAVDGAVEVVDYILGDVDGDGQILAKDVAALRRYLAHWSGVTIIEPAADVNKDSNITAQDVAILRRYLAHWTGVTLAAAPAPQTTARSILHRGANDPTIKFSSAESNVGDQVTLNVDLLNNPGIVSAYLDLSYDNTKLKLISVEDTELLKGALFSNDYAIIPFALNWDDSIASANNTGSGTIAKLTFEILDGCQEGAATVSVSYVDGNILNYDLNNVDFVVESGTVSVHVHQYAEAVTAPTCTERGYTTYTCACGDSYVDDYTAATGHDWNEATYVWAEDNSTVTATRVCKNNPEHTETETVNTTSEVTKEATVDEEGEITYTAEFTNPAFEKQTKVVAVPKLKPVNPFEDVAEGKFYYDAVLWAVAHEPQITNGTDATHFSPDATCTRGQVVTFLWRAKGCPEPTKTVSPFTDVTGGFYYKAVLWAVENEITNGTSATTFGPNDGCTRGQVVTFLWRTEGKPEPTAENIPFEDVTGGFYYKAVLWAVENKITAGMDATHFAPMNTCTRGQIVTFLYRDLAE